MTLVSYDDRSMADATRQATERLITGDRVDLLFGPYSAGLTTAAADVAESHGKVLWNHGGAGDAPYVRGNRQRGSILTPADQYWSGRRNWSGRPIRSQQACDTTDRYGIFCQDRHPGVETVAHELGFTTTLDLRYRPTQVRFAEIARHIADLEPDLVVAVGRIRHDIATARALARLPNRNNIGMAVVVATPIAGFADMLGRRGRRIRGAQPVGADCERFDAGRRTRSQGCTADTGECGRDVGCARGLPDGAALAAGLIAERCVAAAGELQDDALREAAASADFTTFYGRFSHRRGGRQIGRSVALVQRQGGRKVVVWPSELAEGELRYPF